MKVSKFNYCLFNKENELLLYNSFLGSSSFCKINEKEAPVAYALLKSKSPKITNENSFLYNKLLANGFIIDDFIDEDALMYAQYIKSINDNHLHLVINPTDSCNFKCIYCYECDSNSFMSTEIQDDIINFVKKEIHKFKGLKVSWFGGEPLLAMDTIEKLSRAFIEICAKTKRSYIATITTNGYLLSIENFMKLLDYRVIHYQITLDGIKLIHDRQRPLKSGKGTFDKIIENLYNIKEKCNRAIYTISLRTNYTKDVLPYLDEYLDLIETKFMNNRHFDILIRPADDWGGERVKSSTSILFGNNKDYIREVFNKMHGRQLSFKLMKGFFDPGGNFCYAAQLNSYSINSQGEISKCTTDLKNNPFAKIGQIYKGVTINEHDAYKWLISYENTCSCFFKPVCLGIKCPKALFEQKHILSDNTYSTVQCPFEKDYIDDLFILFDNIGMFSYLDV